MTDVSKQGFSNSNLDTRVKTLGVLGGMGAAATVDFLERLVQGRDVSCDQEHLRWIAFNDVTIPDRSIAIQSQDSQLIEQIGIQLSNSAGELERAGATALVITCNGAHYWIDSIKRKLSIPIIDIRAAAINEISRKKDARRVAIMASPATLKTRLYAEPLEQAGFEVLQSTSIEEFAPIMRAVKSGFLEEGRVLAETAVDYLKRQGADTILLACTEFPIALAHRLQIDPSLIDATQCLVDVCLSIDVTPQNVEAELSGCAGDVEMTAQSQSTIS